MTTLAASFEEVPPTMRRALAFVVGAWLVLGLVHAETISTMVGIWARSDTFAHAFLVPPISLWLMWRNRQRLWAVTPQASPGWLVALGVASLAWLAGDLAYVNALTQFAVVAMIVAVVPLLLGQAAGRVLAFPLLYLFFCVPVGEFLLPTLMEGTADFTVSALRMSGIPVFREGLSFVIPSGSWSVVEACSGVRYLIASVMVGTLFAYLNYRSLVRRLVFVGVSIVVPIVANWLRAYMIVMLGHLSDNKIATGVDHLVYGWVFFGVVISIMFFIGSRWSEPELELDKSLPLAGGAGMPASASPALGTWVAALGVALAPLLAVHAFKTGVGTGPVEIGQPAAPQAGWQLAPGPADWSPKFQGAARMVQTTYRRGADSVTVTIAYYRNQGADRKLVSSMNVLVASDDRQWHPVATGLRPASPGPGPSSWLGTHLLGGAAGLTMARRHMTVWQTYWADGAFESRAATAKLHGALGVLMGRGDDGAAVILHTPLDPDAGGNALLNEFAREHMAGIERSLQQARKSP